MAKDKLTVERTNDVVEVPEVDDGYVTVRLFFDGDKFKDPVQVGHNGTMYSVPRGKDVKVPWFVAAILREQEEADAKSRQLMRQLDNNFTEMK